MALSMRSLKMSVGTAAKAGASAPITSKFRSGIWLSSHRLGFCPYACKKLCNRIPDLFAPTQAFPVNANQTYEFVAGINGDDVVLTNISHPVYEQCLHIGLQVFQDGIVTGKRLPILKDEQGLHRPSRTGIESHATVGDCALKDINHVDGDHQFVPLLITHLEIRQRQVASGHKSILPASRTLTIEEYRASLTSADHCMT